MICNNDSDVDHGKFEHDDIEGVYDHDTQCNLNPQNLNPENKNDNDHVNQMDDANDSSCSDSKQEDDNFPCNDCESKSHTNASSMMTQKSFAAMK